MRSGDSIGFTTSLLDISKRIDHTNPYSQNAHRAIWNSLKRLRGVVLEISKKGIPVYIGGIIGSARLALENLEDHGGKLRSTADLNIYVDSEFLELEENHYTMLDPEILLQLKSKPREFCVYLFLSRQTAFYKGGWYQCGVDKLHDYAGLRPENKQQHQIRYELLDTLKGLQDKAILTWHQNRHRIAVHKGLTDSKPDWSVRPRK